MRGGKSDVLVIPALDLRGGACVRMREGDLSTAVVCDDDPVRRAAAFVKDGARRLHVIDIGGAFGESENLATIARICRAAGVPVQAGGGVRDVERALRLMDAGVSDVILGTILAEDEDAAAAIAERLHGHAIAAIDARGTRVATRGWKRDCGVDRDGLVRRVSAIGITRIIFTEISRDGTGQGFDVDALNDVAANTTCLVTASGGARSLADADDLAVRARPNVDSCIVGSALYALFGEPARHDGPLRARIG